MRILVLADLHGEEAALAKAREMARDYGIVIVAGDIGASRGFLEDLLSMPQNIFIIPGNSDPESLLDVAGDRCIHGKRVDIGEGLNLVGFGYSPPTPFGTPGEFPEEKLYGWMNALPIDEKTIFMTHAPPYGIMDEARGGHAGSRAVLRILGEKAPLANVCGHIHEKEGVEMLGRTTVLKVGAAKLGRCGELIIDGGKVSAKAMGL